MNVKSLYVGIVVGAVIMAAAVIMLVPSAKAKPITTFAIDQYVPQITDTGALVIVDLSTGMAQYVRMEGSKDVVHVR